MSKSSAVQQFTLREGSGIVVMSRVTDWQGIAVTKAQVSSITYYVYDLETGASQPTLKATGTVTVASSWSDTYSLTGWTADKIGYNSYTAIPASAFTFPLTRVKGSKCQVEIVGTPASGDQFWIADLTIDVVDGMSRGT